MREILFRGKSLDNGEWVEGAFCMKDCDDPFGELKDNPSIIKYGPPFDGFWFRVNPETVGQFTGLTDKNGQKIFEGDIVRYYQKLLGGVKYEHKDPVMFLEGGFVVGVYFLNHWLRDIDNGNIQLEGIEVIGNIHDNPELLEGRTEDGKK